MHAARASWLHSNLADAAHVVGKQPLVMCSELLQHRHGACSVHPIGAL